MKDLFLNFRKRLINDDFVSFLVCLTKFRKSAFAVDDDRCDNFQGCNEYVIGDDHSCYFFLHLYKDHMPQRCRNVALKTDCVGLS